MLFYDRAGIGARSESPRGVVNVKWSDLADALNEWLDRLAGTPAPRPIPVRADDRRGPKGPRR